MVYASWAVPSVPGTAAGAPGGVRCRRRNVSAYLYARDVPFATTWTAVAYGSNVTLVYGLLSDVHSMVNERKQEEGCSTSPS